MTDYMQEIARILKLAEVPGVEILQSDEAIFAALKGHIASMQDIACKSDTWRLANENLRTEMQALTICLESAERNLEEIRQALIDSEDVPSDTDTYDAVVSTVKLALMYLHDARHSANLYASQLATLEKSIDRTIADRTSELRQKIDVLERQVQFHRDTAKNLEGYNEGLAQALRIVLNTVSRP